MPAQRWLLCSAIAVSRFDVGLEASHEVGTACTVNRFYLSSTDSSIIIIEDVINHMIKLILASPSLECNLRNIDVETVLLRNIAEEGTGTCWLVII